MMTRYTYLMGCLTIGMVLTSCIDEKDEFVTESQGNVVTQIAISVPGTPNTRMTVDATQADETFRGMKDITLIPFSAATYYEGESYPVGAGYRRLGTESYIPTTLGQGDIHAQNHSHLYFDVSLPLGTNAFLVYGRSAAETNGDLTAAGLNSATPSGISFTPVPFVENTDAWTVEGGKGYAIIAYLNSIFATQQDGIDWTNGTTYPVLNALFPMVKNMRAGSSASVLAFIQTIYDQLKGSATAAGVSEVIAAIKEGATYDSAGDAITVEELPDGKVMAVLGDKVSGYDIEKVTDPDTGSPLLFISCYRTRWESIRGISQSTMVMLGDKKDLGKVYYYPSPDGDELIYSGEKAGNDSGGVQTLPRLIYNGWLIIGIAASLVGLIIYFIFRKKYFAETVLKIALIPIALTLSIPLCLMGRFGEVYNAAFYLSGIVLLAAVIYVIFILLLRLRKAR